MNDDRPGTWCLVANFSAPGTKHFRTGAKAYCLSPCNGTGYESIKILAHHRGSPHRLLEMYVSSKRLENWRARLVYHPHVVLHAKGWGDFRVSSDGGAQSNIEYFVHFLIHRAMARHTNTWLHSGEGDREMEIDYGQSLSEEQELALAELPLRAWKDRTNAALREAGQSGHADYTIHRVRDYSGVDMDALSKQVVDFYEKMHGDGEV